MDDFNLLTTKDRQDMSYALCLGGATIGAVAIGRFVGLPGVIAGAATGLAIGLLTCKRLTPVIEKKLFSTTDSLTDHELLTVLRLLREETGVRSKSDAMYLLSQVKVAVLIRGEAIHNNQAACMLPRVAAAELLSRRSPA